MAFLPGTHRRRSIRLKCYDYRLPGAYFITVVTHNRQRLFGDIIDGRMRLSPCGAIVRDEWLNSAVRRPGIALDAFVVMPDHVHGIVIIRDGRAGDNPNMPMDRRGTARRAPTVADCGARASRRAPIGMTDIDIGPSGRDRIHAMEHFGRPVPGSIPTIVRSFKSAATKGINECRGSPGARVWQRNYYERIIRDHAALRRIRTYVVNNPAKG